MYQTGCWRQGTRFHIVLNRLQMLEKERCKSSLNLHRHKTSNLLFFFFKFGTREGADFLSKANSYSLGNSDFFAFMFNSGNILLKDN